MTSLKDKNKINKPSQQSIQCYLLYKVRRIFDDA